jgi:heat shock protein HspQ
MSIFNDKTLKSVADIVSQIIHQESTHPKTEKEKKLAALAEPKDKITHKDVLVGRGVLNKEEVEELDESHFNLGDTVKCKASGMSGKVIKLDKEHGSDDEKYYTVKRSDGKEMKYAPNELSLMEEVEQIDEVSLDKASSAYAARIARMRNSKDGSKDYDKAVKTHMHISRKYGVDGLIKADKKRNEEVEKHEKEMHKESTEQLQEYESKDGVYRHKGTYGKSKGTEYGSTDWDKEEKDKSMTSKSPVKRGARQNYIRSKKVSGKTYESFSDMITMYKENGLKSLSEMFFKEEPDNEQFTKELEAAKKKASEKKTPEDEARVAKASVQAVKIEEDAENDEYIVEKKLTSDEMKKREEVAQAIERDNPDMPMSKKMAIATATAKKVAEEVEEGVIDTVKRAVRGVKRGIEADNKGWKKFGQTWNAAQDGDDEAARKFGRDANRYRNLGQGAKGKTAGGFPKSTNEVAPPGDKAEQLDEENPVSITSHFTHADGKKNAVTNFTAKAASDREAAIKKSGGKITGRTLNYASGKKDHRSVSEEVEELDEAAPFKDLHSAVKYATDSVKTHRDPDDGIEIHKHKSGGYDVNHTMNSNGRNWLKTSGAKHLGTVYKNKPHNIKEEVEELDELTTNTLKSYRSKAIDSMRKHNNAAKISAYYDQDYEHADKHTDKAQKRRMGFNMAGKKLSSRGALNPNAGKSNDGRATNFKEEAEQLDELSKKTLGSYVNKAAAQGQVHRSLADKSDDENNTYTKEGIRHRNKASKRLTGIRTAVKKLSN